MASVFVRLAPPLWLTIALSMTALAIATPLGLAPGALRSELGPRHWAPLLIDGWVFLVRGTPILVQIFAIYFLLPAAGIKLPLFWMGVAALVFNAAGYQIETGRAAVQSVPKGQWEAAGALGFSRRATLISFILPQAARRMVGPVMNELSQLIKASSVLSIISANLRFTEVLIVEGLWYFIFIYGLSLMAGRLEQHFSASGGLAASR